MNIKESEEAARKIINELISVYYKGVDEKKVTPQQMFKNVAEFVFDCYGLVTNKDSFL